MSARLVPLIVCGGSGSRLEPVSQDGRPKQFLCLLGRQSTFQETLCRVADAAFFAPPVIVANRDHRALLDDQLREIGAAPARVVLEPEKRGSGPAILAGIFAGQESLGADALILALAADHRVHDVEGFRRTCQMATAAAEAGAIVTFGVAPDHPATGYGYIEPGEECQAPARAVRRFIEKPDAESAARYMRDGFLWNSGNFLFRASTLLEEYRRFDEATVDAVAMAVRRSDAASGQLHLDPRAFAQAAANSVDYAVLEKTARAAVVRADFDWTDIGSWAALHRLLSREGHAPGNRIRSLTLGPAAVFSSTPLDQAEYWIVAEGTAAIAGMSLCANEFMRVPAGTPGVIANAGKGDLRLLRAAIEEA